MADSQTPQTLKYKIAGSSEHSGGYVAENIMVNNPTDQGSRWSGAHQAGHVKEWILLRLEKLSVLTSITFGKFHKAHPCNMKEFKLYVGLSEDNMTPVLHSGLKNDPTPETFALPHVNKSGVRFPARYVKIVPLSAHGQSFHASIWHVTVTGIVDEGYVERIRAQHEEFRETAILRQVLKHLRQRRFLGPYQSILSSTNIQLEHPTITSLHTALVLQGDFARAESLLVSMAEASLFTSALLSAQPYTQWSRLTPLDEDGDVHVPSARGGHAMCIDYSTGDGVIYLLGGWNGQKSLDDFWEYDVRMDRWKTLSLATGRERNGPGPRACHKMVFDPTSGYIYVLGRLGEPESAESHDPTASAHGSGVAAPSSSPVLISAGLRRDDEGSVGLTPEPTVSNARTSEFYRYHTRGIDTGKWEVLSHDTGSSDGPPLVFDHQMVLDSEAQMIYVSGGRIVDDDWDHARYAELYSYDIRTSRWKKFQSSDPSSTHPSIPSRFGHSMVLDPHSQTLFIFAGQRDDKYLSDMYAFHIPSNTVTELFSNFSTSGGPDACFTQRVVIDPDLREIYVFSGLTRARPGTQTVLDNDSPYWIYRYDRPDRPGKWTKILPVGASASSSAAVIAPPESRPEPETPVSRYAHQVVYNPHTKTAYMHGGNAGSEEAAVAAEGDAGGDVGHRREGSADTIPVGELGKERRLDDFWSMRLKRPSPEDMVRRGRFLIKQQQFREMCEDTSAVKALTFLQVEVSSVVNHSDAEEAKQFRSLLSHLLQPPLLASEGSPSRKRSRPETPVEDRDGKLEEQPQRQDEPMPDVPNISSASPASLIKMKEDPEERKLSGSATPPSPARFKQRTEVFEKMLEFVNKDVKQPEKDLLGVIDVDGWEA